MEQSYISDDVFEQIKDFVHHEWNLTEEQKLLIDKLIPDEELKQHYKDNGLCKGCKQLNTGNHYGRYWCQPCNSKRFQQNFRNWTSGNSDVDKLIQESQLNAEYWFEKLEWVEYDEFENIKYIARGGFGKVYKAIWKDGYIESWNYKTNQWNRNEYRDGIVVALKCLNNSKDITLEFLNEVNSHVKMNPLRSIITCYGITKDPKTNDFMMVMQYASEGSLRQNLNKYFNSMDWRDKFRILVSIAEGLFHIHDEGLVHQDFHSGNILQDGWSHITDLGLCKPANEKSKKCNNNVYGVLPYVAPEVLRGKEYTQASDIYGFGIIIYEVFNVLPPYHDMPHDELLAVEICQGLRPKFIVKVPKLVEDIFKQCVDADPLKRPTAEDLFEKFKQWYCCEINYDNTELYKQAGEADEFNAKRPMLTNSLNDTELAYATHPQAIYTSRLLNFRNLPEPKNTDDELIEEGYSKSIKIEFANLNINP